MIFSRCTFPADQFGLDDAAFRRCVRIADQAEQEFQAGAPGCLKIMSDRDGALASSLRPLDDIFKYVSPFSWKAFVPDRITFAAYATIFTQKGY